MFTLILISILVASLLLASSLGAVSIPLIQIPNLLLYPAMNEEQALFKMILIDIRLPRLVLAMVVGGGLAISGCTMQALFRNPLAEPGLLGISSGAALGAVSAIVLGSHGILTVSGSAFVGALVAIFIAWQLGQRFSYIAGLLLAGIAINAIAGSLTGLLTYFASNDQLRSITFWQMGSLAQADWPMLSWLAPTVLLFCCLIFWEWRALNVLLLGERESSLLGFNLPALKCRFIFYTACIVGLIVAACGIIGFVGLIVPHLIRMVFGPNHRILLPVSLLSGALLVLLSDLVARLIILPAELPIGLVTSLIGGPFFILLLFSRRRAL